MRCFTTQKMFPSSHLLVVVFLACVSSSYSVTLENGNVTLNFNITTNDGIYLSLIRNNSVKLTGHVGIGVSTLDSTIKFEINEAVDGFNIFWETSDTSKTLQDCFDFLDFDWFTGKEDNSGEWPIQQSVIDTEALVVTSTNSINEPYWLSSGGSFIFVNETVPLFVDQNNLQNNVLCLIAKIDGPYVRRTRVLLNYTIAANDNAKEAHRNAIDNHLRRPTGQPNTQMMREPIWSTWGKFQDDINDQLLLDFAQSIEANGFRGQVQIENGWEDCRGSLSFKKLQFAAINSTVMNINGFALRVTLWIHPFVETDCETVAQIGLTNGYFVKGADGREIVTSWTYGNSSYLVDFTNDNAKNWFAERVGLLVEKHRLDGFKFDGGEASWATSDAVFQGDVERAPNEITAAYNSISNFTEYVHVHSGWRTQWLPVLVSIAEKEPNWSQENGLKSVLINLFQLNLAGYTMVLPGLIGGKSSDRPSSELFVRWTQAVTFMPAMQFGYLPWEIIGSSFDVLAIVKKSIDLHYWYADGITNIVRKSKNMGLPVNAPVWWADPTNPDTFKILDQYMLGENIMAAPVLDEGVVSRDIYLPPGKWRDGYNNTIYEDGVTLKDYPAPIDVVPYFTRESDS